MCDFQLLPSCSCAVTWLRRVLRCCDTCSAPGKDKISPGEDITPEDDKITPGEDKITLEPSLSYLPHPTPTPNLRFCGDFTHFENSQVAQTFGWRIEPPSGAGEWGRKEF